jgi:hypothetical protein
MFGRKRKKEEDALGLSAFGSTASVAPSAAPTPAETAGTVGTPTPVATPPAAFVRLTTKAEGATPQVFTGGMQFGTSDVLKQMFGGKGPISDLVKEIQSDPQAFRAKMMAQAQAAGVSTFVMTPQGFQQAGAAGAAPPQHVDVIDELTKAADLHDKGALTDAEFEALKHKLLGH